MKPNLNNAAAKEVLATHIELLRVKVNKLMSTTLMENKLRMDNLRLELKLDEEPVKFKVNTASDINGNTAGHDQGTSSSFEFPSNQEILRAVEIIHPLIKEYHNDLTTLRDWLNFQTKKMETGSAFSSKVVQRLSASVTNVLYGVGVKDYLAVRAELVGKAVKYPQSEDAVNAIFYHDYVYKMDLDRILFRHAQYYAEIYNTMIKNWDTVTSVEEEDNNAGIMY